MLALLAPLAALPWLQGFFVPAAATDTPTRDVGAAITEWREPVEDCVATAYGGLTLQADFVSTDGAETVLATYSQGVFVLDRDRHIVAQAPGWVCEGSADELIAIAVGDVSIGQPIVALAATKGGRAESVTWLTLYRVADSGELQPIFIGEVERHGNHATRTGLVTVIPGGLVYRDPQGTISMWTYDNERGRYIEQTTTRPFA